MLSLQIYSDSSRTRLLADLSSRIAANGVRLAFSTNGHGFAALVADGIPAGLWESHEIYTWPGLPHVVLSDSGAGVAWEGRLEDIGIVAGGVSLVALGYQRALYDAPYTALWSKTATSEWRAVTGDELSGATPERYEIDVNNRLYIALKKNEVFYDNTNFGALTYAAPDGGERSIVRVEADYAVLLPTGMRARLYSSATDFTSDTIEAFVSGNGALQTGTWTLTTTARFRVRFQVGSVDSAGGNYAMSDDTGDYYAKLTGVRIMTTTATEVLASDIAAALAEWVNGVNGDQLRGDGMLIEPTTTDLHNEIYEDLLPAEILDRHALLHGYEWGVYEDRRLHFRPRGAGRQWYVDVARVPELQRSIENMRNSAYAVYRRADGRTMRTATAVDADSRARYGLTRRGFIDVQTTSATEAQTHRGLFLSDRADASARAGVVFDRLYDATGSAWPLYAMRAGDTVTMRNLPPTLSTEIDRIRTFRVAETEYDAATGELSIAPEEPLPSLDVLVARREAGLWR
jgi:hypothetical protein